MVKFSYHAYIFWGYYELRWKSFSRTKKNGQKIVIIFAESVKKG